MDIDALQELKKCPLFSGIRRIKDYRPEQQIFRFYPNWKVRKKTSICLTRIYCGSGGNRTLVRTRKPYAFYMLIPAFIFVMQQDPDHQLHPYPLKLHPIIEAWQDYFRFNLRRLIFGFGTTSSERRLVLSPGDGIEPQSTILRLGSESILIVAN